jgi:hypothetical protein
MDLDTAFERDLERWLGEIYDRLDAWARYDEHAAVEGVLERENRLLMVLIAILGGSIFLLPLAGGMFMIGALGLLYVGAFGSSLITIVKIRRLERRSARRDAVRRRRQEAWTTRPELGPELRAQLIRIMNLSQLRTTASTRKALEVELAEARGHAALAAWPPLTDAEVMTRGRPARSFEA